MSQKHPKNCFFVEWQKETKKGRLFCGHYLVKNLKIKDKKATEGVCIT